MTPCWRRWAAATGAPDLLKPPDWLASGAAAGSLGSEASTLIQGLPPQDLNPLAQPACARPWAVDAPHPFDLRPDSSTAPCSPGAKSVGALPLPDRLGGYLMALNLERLRRRATGQLRKFSITPRPGMLSPPTTGCI